MLSDYHIHISCVYITTELKVLKTNYSLNGDSLNGEEWHYFAVKK